MKTPRSPAKRAAHFSCFFPPYSFFFSPDWLSSDLLFLSALSHQESHLPEPIFPSLGAHLQHECGKLPFHKLSLHRLRLSQHFHWPFIGNYAYKRLLMQIQLRWGRSSGGSFLFCFFNVYNDSCFIFKPALKLEHLSILCNGFISGTLSLPLLFAPRTAQ